MKVVDKIKLFRSSPPKVWLIVLSIVVAVIAYVCIANTQPMTALTLGEVRYNIAESLQDPQAEKIFWLLSCSIGQGIERFQKIKVYINDSVVFKGVIDTYDFSMPPVCGIGSCNLKNGSYRMRVINQTVKQETTASFSSDKSRHIEISMVPLDIIIHESSPNYL